MTLRFAGGIVVTALMVVIARRTVHSRQDFRLERDDGRFKCVFATLLVIPSRRRCVNLFNCRRTGRADRFLFFGGTLVVGVKSGDGTRAVGDFKRVPVNGIVLCRSICSFVDKKGACFEVHGWYAKDHSYQGEEADRGEFELFLALLTAFQVL